MIEDMEDELTGASEMYSKNDNSAETEEANVDEDIPIYLQKEQNTQAYKKTMKIDIEKLTHLKR